MSLNTYSLDLEASSSQYVSITDASQTGLDIVGDISLECWVKRESETSSGMLTTKSNFTTPDHSWRWLIANDGDLFFDYSADGTFTNRTSERTDARAVSLGTWTHIAVTADVSAQDIKFYVNGSLVASTQTDAGSGATSIHNSAAPVSIGSWDLGGTPAAFYDGLIDECRIWNDVRTAAEISNNYQTQLNGDEAGLVAYWRFNNDYTDETANGNNLTATASPVFSTDVPFPGTEDGGNNILINKSLYVIKN